MRLSDRPCETSISMPEIWRWPFPRTRRYARHHHETLRRRVIARTPDHSTRRGWLRRQPNFWFAWPSPSWHDGQTLQTCERSPISRLRQKRPRVGCLSWRIVRDWQAIEQSEISLSENTDARVLSRQPSSVSGQRMVPACCTNWF